MTRRQMFWRIARVASTHSDVLKLVWDGTAEHYYGLILTQMERAEQEARARIARGEEPPFDVDIGILPGDAPL